MSYFMFSPVKSEISIENIHSHGTKSPFPSFSIENADFYGTHTVFRWNKFSVVAVAKKNRRQKVCDEEK